jgi:hypothetical protein
VSKLDSLDLLAAPFGVRPIPDPEQRTCTYQVRNYETNENVGEPYPYDQKMDALKEAHRLNHEWQQKKEGRKNLLTRLSEKMQISRLDRTGGGIDPCIMVRFNTETDAQMVYDIFLFLKENAQ